MAPARTQLLRMSDLSADVLTVIGEIVAEFGRIEYEVKLAIKNMVGEWTKGLKEAEEKRHFDPIAKYAIAKAQKQFGRKRASNLVKLLKAASQLARKRHDIVHGCWFGDDKLVRMKFYKRSRRLRHFNYTVSLDQLRLLAFQLKAVRLGIHRERFLIAGQVPPEEGR